VMKAVVDFAGRGGAVLGICNGFQVLCESGLLPGALVRNRDLEFICRTVSLRAEQSLAAGGLVADESVVRIPIGHGAGKYRIDDAGLDALQENDPVRLRYASPEGQCSEAFFPSGALDPIAG